MPPRKKLEDAPDLSADIAAQDEAVNTPPAGADLVLPMTAVPRAKRAAFFRHVADGPRDALNDIDVANDPATVSAVMGAAADVFETLAAMEEALCAIARPDCEDAIRALDDDALGGLFGWVIQALRPGEAQPSPIS